MQYIVLKHILLSVNYFYVPIISYYYYSTFWSYVGNVEVAKVLQLP